MPLYYAIQEEKKKTIAKTLKGSKNQTYKSKGIKIRIKVYKFTSCCKASRTLDGFLHKLPY